MTNRIVTPSPRPPATRAARRCAFIAGEGPFHGRTPFCDAAAMQDSSYCGAHHALCYMPSKKSRADGKSGRYEPPRTRGIASGLNVRAEPALQKAADKTAV